MLKPLNEVIKLIQDLKQIYVFVPSEKKESSAGSMIASTPIEITKSHARDWAEKVAPYNDGQVPCWLTGMNELVLGFADFS